MPKFISVSFIIIAVVCLCGCSTLKNTALGAAGVAKGIAEDTYNTWKAMGKADQWMKDNLW